MSMIIISQLIPCKPFSLSSQISQLSPKSPLLLLSATANSLRPSSSSSSSFPSHKSINRRPGARWEFQVLAADDEREIFSGAAAAAKIAEVKKRLVDEFYGMDRGLRASSETRAQIVELINQIESLNPNPAPTQALSLLNANWILAYTSFSGLFPLLSSTTLPLVKVEEISQTIDSENFTVQNSVKFAGPLATTSVSTNAKFEVRSPKRVQIKFVEGIIGTPQLTDSIVIPENVEFLGQKFDLTPFKGLLNSVNRTELHWLLELSQASHR